MDAQIQELVKRQTLLQRQVDGLIKPEKSPDLISPFLALPGLVGYWPMSSIQRSTGNAFDLSGQARTLTYNGNPTYTVFNSVVPIINLDGTGDFLSRADETDLDILGTETIYAAAVRGLTLGGWFLFDTIGVDAGLISKFGAAGQRSYMLEQRSSDTVQLRVSVDGTALIDVTSGVITTAQWYFIVGRFTPSTETAIWVNGVKTVNTTSIPASIFNSTSALQIGAFASANTVDGRASLCFLSANALTDAVISSLFQQTRVAFEV